MENQCSAGDRLTGGKDERATFSYEAARPGREGSHGWDQYGTNVEPSKTTHGEITLDLSAAAGPAAEGRQEDDQEDVGQKDGQKGRGGGGGETTG